MAGITVYLKHILYLGGTGASVLQEETLKEIALRARQFVAKSLDLGEQSMGSSGKTNRLAAVSFVSGLIALLSLGFYWALFSIAFPPSPGYSPEPASRVITTIMDLSVSLRNLCAITALVTGILGLRDIKKKAGTEKGKTFAWIGVILGAGWILFGLLVGITFLLAEILH